MRVIDARIAAMEIAKIMAYEANMENGGAGYHYTQSEFMDAAEVLLENIPMLEMEPICHGHWIDTGSGQECSECGEIQYGYDSGRYFCQNCGARMETENE